MEKRLCRFALAVVVLAPVALVAQGGPPAGQRPPVEEKATPIENGGIFVKGWTGIVDEGAVKQGQSEKDSSFKAEGGGFHVMTGPAITYLDAKKATGDFTVSATFTEPHYMNRNTHPHPYGVVIAGGGKTAADQSALYCAAYGSGTFIVRGFGPAAFQLNGRRGEANDAVHKAAGPGEPVTQTIAIQVKGGNVSCVINGTTVGTYAKADVVGEGKLTTTDGQVGIRMAHNTDVLIKDFKVTK